MALSTLTSSVFSSLLCFYLLLLRGGGSFSFFFAESAPLQHTPLPTLISREKYGSWCVVLCQKQVYIFFLKIILKGGSWLKQRGEWGKLLFLGYANTFHTSSKFLNLWIDFHLRCCTNDVCHAHSKGFLFSILACCSFFCEYFNTFLSCQTGKLKELSLTDTVYQSICNYNNALCLVSFAPFYVCIKICHLLRKSITIWAATLHFLAICHCSGEDREPSGGVLRTNKKCSERENFFKSCIYQRDAVAHPQRGG